MKDLRFTPKSNGKKEKAKAAFIAAIAVIFFVLGILPIPGKGFCQLLFVVFVAIDIMYCVKYFLTSYTYTLTDEYGDPMIIVTQTQGKKISTLANFRIADIVSVEVKPPKIAKEEISRKYGSSCIKYNYLSGEDNELLIMINVRNDYTRYIIMISYDVEFYNAICELHSRVKEFSDDEE